jgi:hypothetical protein
MLIDMDGVNGGRVELLSDAVMVPLVAVSRAIGELAALDELTDKETEEKV